MTDVFDLNDDDLIERGRAGDSVAQEALVRRYRDRVVRIVSRYARDSADAEDLAQEVFVKAIQRLDQFAGRAPFEFWIRRIAVHTCYDALRKRRRRPELRFADLSDEQQHWLEKIETPHHSSAGIEAQEMVRMVLEILPAEARMVLTLLEIEDRSVKEVAELTGWSVALVKVRAFRARALMRNVCEKIMAKET
jgi:RNA polymerase sigma-70 factor (ECF subfamily)